MFKKVFKFCFISGLTLGLLAAAGGLGFGIYYYFQLTEDLPRIDRISDYRPKAVTQVYSNDGTIIAELFEERRYPVKFEEIPRVVRNAFLAAEDANFYQHPGIDIISIMRAFWINIQAQGTRQGASTITQQIVKSLLLTREKTYKRKAKEAILSYRLERALTKNEIFSIYLNEIFLGATAYGVKAAAKVHFRKELVELTLAEAAYLAAMPQKPSYLANPRHRDKAIKRQHYVLGQMLRNRMIDQQELEKAKAQELEIFPPENQRIVRAPYFTSHAIKVLEEKLKEIDPKLSATTPGGFQVHTTLDLNADDIAKRALRRGLKQVDKRQGWRGPLDYLKKEELEDPKRNPALFAIRSIEKGTDYKAVVTGIKRKSGVATVRIGPFVGTLNLRRSKWAERVVQPEKGPRISVPRLMLKPGHVIEVSVPEKTKQEFPWVDIEKEVGLALDQIPELQSAFVVSDPLTGEVKTIQGGYSYKKSVFNRATQGLLQPGSGFKPFIYLAAIDELDFTPATIVPDSPISMVDGTGEVWSPQNYDEKFIGPITLRTALQRSRNVVSVYLITKIGVEKAIEYARKLGITTPIPPEMSISLGAAEVKPIELVRAYGVFAASGWLADSMIISSVVDRSGEKILQVLPKQKKVISEDSAFIMANMMKGVVERGTAQLIKKLKRPVAGKTGTTNEQMDAWFIGYTPEIVAGAWVGYDVKKTIGDKETGGRAAAPIFLYFMQEYLVDEPDLDFEIPDGVVPFRINLDTGFLAEPGDTRAFTEYFMSGTEPTQTSAFQELPQEYLSNEDF